MVVYLKNQRDRSMKGILFFGAPGSGKGTQTHLLSGRLHIPVIGMGQLLRREVTQETPLGKKIAPVLEKGQHLDTMDVMSILKSQLTQCPGEWVLLDGVPRSLEQAQAVEHYAFDKPLTIVAVIYLQISPKKVAERIQSRSSCAHCHKDYCHTISMCSVCGSTEFSKRLDDTEAIVLKRLEVFHEGIADILDFYKKKGVLCVIQGDQEIEHVYADIVECLTSLMKTVGLPTTEDEA
jgi:adenylate kinase